MLKRYIFIGLLMSIVNIGCMQHETRRFAINGVIKTLSGHIDKASMDGRHLENVALIRYDKGRYSLIDGDIQSTLTCDDKKHIANDTFVHRNFTGKHRQVYVIIIGTKDDTCLSKINCFISHPKSHSARVLAAKFHLKND